MFFISEIKYKYPILLIKEIKRTSQRTRFLMKRDNLRFWNFRGFLRFLQNLRDWRVPTMIEPLCQNVSIQ